MGARGSSSCPSLCCGVGRAVPQLRLLLCQLCRYTWGGRGADDVTEFSWCGWIGAIICQVDVGRVNPQLQDLNRNRLVCASVRSPMSSPCAIYCTPSLSVPRLWRPKIHACAHTGTHTQMHASRKRTGHSCLLPLPPRAPPARLPGAALSAGTGLLEPSSPSNLLLLSALLCGAARVCNPAEQATMRFRRASHVP